MKRRRRSVSGLFGLAAVLACAPAAAHGPGTHISECDAVLAHWRQEPGSALDPRDPELLAAPDALFWFHVGCLFPDLARQVPEITFEPHRLNLMAHVLARTHGGDPLLRAFALGNAMHGTADMSAQVLLVPWLTGATGHGAMDLIPGAFDGPGGENELVLESLGDFYHGDLARVIELLAVADSEAEEPLDLGAVIGPWHAVATELYDGGGYTGEDAVAGVRRFMDRLSERLAEISPQTLRALLDQLQASPPGQMLDFLLGVGAPLLAAGGVDLGPVRVDPVERQRLLSSEFLEDVRHGRGPHWPAPLAGELPDGSPGLFARLFGEPQRWQRGATWRGAPLRASYLQSLGHHSPQYAPQPEILVWSLLFTDERGPVTQVARAQLPVDVQVELELYSLSDRRLPSVSVEVVGYRVAGEEQVLAREAFGGAVGPISRARVEVPVQVPAGYSGVYVTLVDEDGQRVFATARRAYEVDTVNLDLPPWRAAFAGAGDWQPALAIEPPLVGASELRLRAVSARNSRFPVAGARVVIDGAEHEADGQGYVTLRDVEAGAAAWEVAADGFVQADGVVDIVDGSIWAEAAVEPVAAFVQTPPAWVSDDEVVLSIPADPRFALGQAFEVALLTDGSEVWSASSRQVVVGVAGLQDGTQGRIGLRAVGVAGTRGSSTPFHVDRSPPSAPAFAVEDGWIVVTADDPHAPVVAVTVSLDAGEPVVHGAVAEIAVPSAPGAYAFVAHATNAAGLDGPASTWLWEVAAPPDLAPDLGVPDATDVGPDAQEDPLQPPRPQSRDRGCSVAF
jgi:hypothetical protein